MPLNADDLQRITARPGYRVVGPVARLQGAKSEPASGEEQMGLCIREEKGTTRPSTGPSKPEYRLEVTLYRIRLIDPDNAFLKALIDQLRYHSIIPEDNPEVIELIIRQRKVKHRAHEGTSLEITRIKYT